MESLSILVDSLAYSGHRKEDDTVKENTSTNSPSRFKPGSILSPSAGLIHSSPAKISRIARNEAFIPDIIERKLNLRHVATNSTAKEGEISFWMEERPIKLDPHSQILAAIQPHINWKRHLSSPPYFSISRSFPSSDNPLCSGDYIVQIAQIPHLQSIPKDKALSEDEKGSPSESIHTFSDWTEAKRSRAIKTLESIGIPLHAFFIDLVYQLLQSHENDMYQPEGINFPAKYEVVATHRKNEAEIQSESFELELHPDGQAILLFLHRRESCVGKGAYKTAWKVYNLDHEPCMRVQAITKPYLGPTDCTPASQLSTHRYHLLAAREEAAFNLFKGYRWIARVHDIWCYAFMSNQTQIRQQVFYMDYYPMDLFSVVKHHLSAPPSKKLSYKTKLLYSMQVMRAVADIHAQGRVYRDLKLENFLISDKGSLSLTDFGYCEEESKKDTSLYKSGTCSYLPPEVLFNPQGNGDYPIDIWGAGCVLWSLWFEDLYPWYGEAMKGKINEPKVRRAMQQYDERPIDYRDSSANNPYSGHPIRVLIKDMLRMNPDLRLTAQEALRRLNIIKGPISI